MRYENVEIHGAATHRDVDGGVSPQRVPDSVREHLSDGGRDEMRKACATEIRFETAGDVARLTLSAAEGQVGVVPFWGPFRGDPVVVGTEPEEVTFTRPAQLDALADEHADHPFSPNVWRVHLLGGPVVVGDVEGATGPPADGDLPDATLLTYGTSITYGASASRPHLTYAVETARRLGTDLVNLGSSGTAFCEPELADYVAERRDWDAATLSLSVNMYNRERFDLATFRERVGHWVDTVGGTDRPVYCVTLLPFFGDLCPGHARDDHPPEAFRDALREAVADGPDGVHLVEGPDLLDPAGLSADLLHPADAGHGQIGAGLAERLSGAVGSST